MIITVDIDTTEWQEVSASIAIGLDYGFKLESIKKSPGRKGYHITWRTHRVRVQNLNFYDTELTEVVKHRLALADAFGIVDKGSKEDVLRVVLGDDVFRVIYDIKRREIMPQQVLFDESKKYRRYKKRTVKRFTRT